MTPRELRILRVTNVVGLALVTAALVTAALSSLRTVALLLLATVGATLFWLSMLYAAVWDERERQ